MAELADALDLGSSVNRRAGSTPVIRTRKNKSREHCSQLLFLTEANRVLEPGFRSRLPAPKSIHSLSQIFQTSDQEHFHQEIGWSDNIISKTQIKLLKYSLN